jgi:hypothetical protein
MGVALNKGKTTYLLVLFYSRKSSTSGISLMQPTTIRQQEALTRETARLS